MPPSSPAASASRAQNPNSSRNTGSIASMTAANAGSRSSNCCPIPAQCDPWPENTQTAPSAAAGKRAAGHDGRIGIVVGERVQPGHHTVDVLGHHGGPGRFVRAARPRRGRHAIESVVAGAQVVGQRFGLGAQPGGRPRRYRDHRRRSVAARWAVSASPAPPRAECGRSCRRIRSCTPQRDAVLPSVRSHGSTAVGTRSPLFAQSTAGVRVFRPAVGGMAS